MSWILRHHCKAFLRTSLCATSIVWMMAALLLAPLTRSIDESTRWPLLGFGMEGSRAVTGALVSSLLTFLVFAFSIILLVVQVAGGQYSPRIIARVLESRLAKVALGVFTFSFTYTLATLGRIEDRVPQLPILVTVVSSLVSVVMFLFLIQKVGEHIRPVVILTQVADDTRAVINSLYPVPFSAGSSERADLNPDATPAARTIRHAGRSSVVVAFDASGLVEIARRAGCVIELVPMVGDFLSTGEDLFRLRGGSAATEDDREMRQCVALGPERVVGYDPAFGIRIIVDVASKALSPAINDPTTGALAVDQIQHLLRLLSEKDLETGIVRDSSGEVRLVYRTPTWEDFVTLAVTEIRLYGASNPQVTRRLQAMFECLVEVVPAQRSGTLLREMELLQRTIDRAYPDPGDHAIAGTGDMQGFGSGQLPQAANKK